MGKGGGLVVIGYSLILINFRIILRIILELQTAKNLCYDNYKKVKYMDLCSIDESCCNGLKIMFYLFFQLVLILQNIFKFVVVFTRIIFSQFL